MRLIIICWVCIDRLPTFSLVGILTLRIEPRMSGWEAVTLPLCYTVSHFVGMNYFPVFIVICWVSFCSTHWSWPDLTDSSTVLFQLLPMRVQATFLGCCSWWWVATTTTATTTTTSVAAAKLSARREPLLCQSRDHVDVEALIVSTPTSTLRNAGL